jgi:hypothetical protein
MEYDIYLAIQRLLSPSEWIVQKLNLNPQPNMPDVDIGVTHRRTGLMLKLESKPAVRDSMKSGKKTRNIKSPHFKVKCHRSRSNISLSQTSNDRYPEDFFDIIVTNPFNSIIKAKTIGAELEIIEDDDVMKILKEYYSIDNVVGLLDCIRNDWRFVIPLKISVAGFVPRTPYVLLRNDPNWLPIHCLEDSMIDLLKIKLQKR